MLHTYIRMVIVVGIEYYYVDITVSTNGFDVRSMRQPKFNILIQPGGTENLHCQGASYYRHWYLLL